MATLDLKGNPTLPKPSAAVALGTPDKVITPALTIPTLNTPTLASPTLSAPSLTGKIGAKLSTSDKVFGAERFASFGLKKGIHTAGHHLWAPVAMGALALLSEWDHHNQKNHIKREYNQEIAALTGKTPHSVGINDLERVAKSNPVIGEAINRSRLRRNLSIGITVLGGAAALAIGVALTPSIVALGAVTFVGTHAAAVLSTVGLASATAGPAISAAIAETAASTLAFIGIETASEKIGEAKLGLKEPDFKAVNRKPSRQGELSASSQVEYLEHLHARRQPITEAQVMTMFASVNPELATRVQKRYGAAFGKLPEGLKQQAVQQFGADYDICGITNDINNHKVRVQEIAFTAAGQQSGVARFEPPQLVEAHNHARALERENEMLRAKLYDAGQEKLAMHNATVRATVPGRQEMRQPETSWGQRERARDSQRSLQAASGIA